MLMRLSISTEDLDRGLINFIIDALEQGIPEIAVRDRDDYKVLAIIGSMEDIKKAVDIIYPLLLSKAKQ